MEHVVILRDYRTGVAEVEGSPPDRLQFQIPGEQQETTVVRFEPWGVYLDRRFRRRQIAFISGELSEISENLRRSFGNGLPTLCPGILAARCEFTKYLVDRLFDDND